AWRMLNGLGGAPIERERLLAIGDGAETDLRGAQNFGLDALFVTGGIHAEDFGDRESPDPLAIQKCLGAAGVEAHGYITGLTW
ncbi:MAG: HAD hydrolase-like protein, partial [Alphaproteobacteria bacterium]